MLILAASFACATQAPPVPVLPPDALPPDALPPDAIEIVVVPAAPPPDVAGFEDQRKAIFSALRIRVDQLTAAGTYTCCIQTPCSHCALMAGGCQCGPGLARGEPVCHECAMMWHRGQGSIDGVDPASVCSFQEAERAMTYGGRCAPGGDDQPTVITPGVDTPQDPESPEGAQR